MNDPVTVEARHQGGYRVRAQSPDGPVDSVLLLEGADDLSGGLLADDEATARATAQFLLSHQDPADLPATIEIDEVLAAYPDAAQEILARRSR